MTTDSVTLVVPGRNCARTIRLCLASATALADAVPGSLREIIFVDDGSNDETAEIVAEFAVTCLGGDGRGPGSARNIGWRAAKHPLIWFMDSDCVAEPDVLTLLLPHMKDPNVGGVSGSYSNLHARSLLACLVHEEIIERHGRMPRSVNFLATFNVLYRRSVLEHVNGFDERYLKAQDAELSFRVMEAGYELRFEREARVGHHHETRWRSYLETQRQQGYWRVWLHLSHAGHAVGDSYSRLSDHIQPPLALLAIVLTPLLWVRSVSWVPIGMVFLLAAAQVPMAYRLVRRTGRLRFLFHAWMSFIRAFYRGIGLAQGLAGYVASKLRRSH